MVPSRIFFAERVVFFTASDGDGIVNRKRAFTNAIRSTRRCLRLTTWGRQRLTTLTVKESGTMTRGLGFL